MNILKKSSLTSWWLEPAKITKITPHRGVNFKIKPKKE